MIIRPVESKDIQTCISLLDMFFVEGLNKHNLGYDAKSVKNTAQYLFYCGTTLVAEVDGKVVGIISGVMIPFFMNQNSKVWQEILWYVVPEHRKSTIGRRLHKEIEKVVKELGCNFILMAHLTSVNSDRMTRYYEKLGYQLMEKQFLKEL